MTPLAERLARHAAWACVAALAVLSLLPREDMVRTGAAGWMEHAVAYAGTMAMFAIGHRARLGLLRPALALCGYAALLELGQHLSPGRSPALRDALAGAAGALAVALAARAIARR
ncbi:MAG: hypothetical protein ACO3DJ_14875 [Alphaproteobacteria bacterium]|jgi:VanZ family protein